MSEDNIKDKEAKPKVETKVEKVSAPKQEQKSKGKATLAELVKNSRRNNKTIAESRERSKVNR